jgi:hypothetical protein
MGWLGARCWRIRTGNAATGAGAFPITLAARSAREASLSNLNPNSLKVVIGRVEPGVANAGSGARYQIERLGCFCVNTDTATGKPVFNRTVTLRDTWAKIEKASRPGG